MGRPPHVFKNTNIQMEFDKPRWKNPNLDMCPTLRGKVSWLVPFLGSKLYISNSNKNMDFVLSPANMPSWIGVENGWFYPVFKIEVFNALQTWFRPSKYTSLKQPFKTQPQVENEGVTRRPQYNSPATRTNKRRACIVTTRSRARWLILNSSHCTGSMYHIIHTRG